MTQADVVRRLLDRAGTSYAEQAGIKLRDTPSPLYRLLVLSTLLSARISADLAVGAAAALSRHGLRTPRRMLDATWQQRVDALGEGGYRRYDESTATRLGDGAELVLERYRGDLRRMRDAASSVPELRSALEQVPGVGPLGSAIFCREAQGVWTHLVPFADAKVGDGAERLGLPRDPAALARLVGHDPVQVSRLAAACVRVALDDSLADAVRG